MYFYKNCKTMIISHFECLKYIEKSCVMKANLDTFFVSFSVNKKHSI